MMNPLRLSLIILAAIVWLGCADSPEQSAADPTHSEGTQPEQTQKTTAPGPEDPVRQDPVKTPDNTTTPPEPVIDPTHGQLGPGQPAELTPPLNAEPFVRPRRRMQIKQLDVAIRAASGGIGWTEGSGKNEKNLFVKLGATLGVPDLIQVVQEDLTPGAVFQKFLGDAARFVCTKLVEKEVALSAEEPRVLMAYVAPEDTLKTPSEAVEKNLRYLVLRYHGYQPDANDGELASWRWLFESVTHVTDSPPAGWRAVCISLMTHPNFYSY